MVMPSASYAITMRLYLDLDDHRALGRVTTSVGEHDGAVTAVDFVDTTAEHRTVDVTVNARDGDHADELSVGNGQNAGLLAVRVLAASDDDLRTRLDQHRDEIAEKSREADTRVRKRSSGEGGFGFKPR